MSRSKKALIQVKNTSLKQLTWGYHLSALSLFFFFLSLLCFILCSNILVVIILISFYKCHRRYYQQAYLCMFIAIKLVSLGYAEKQNHSMQSNYQLATYHRWPVYEEDVHSGPAKKNIESIILQLLCVCVQNSGRVSQVELHIDCKVSVLPLCFHSQPLSRLDCPFKLDLKT